LTTTEYDRETQPVWSPDGSHLAYVRTHYDDIVEEYFSRIYRIRADGRNATRISRAGIRRIDW
jgi:Tol biopolymer transport system component